MAYLDRAQGDEPQFDEATAAGLVGKYVLIGITTVDSRGDMKSRRQLHGRIVAADANRGIQLKLEGKRRGEDYTLPPDTGAFAPAEPGKYQLLETGEQVDDPDFTSTWQITRLDA